MSRSPTFDYQKASPGFYGLYWRLKHNDDELTATVSMGRPGQMPVLALFYLIESRVDELYERLSSCFNCSIDHLAFDLWVTENRPTIDAISRTLHDADETLCRQFRETPDEEVDQLAPGELFQHLKWANVFDEFLLAISRHAPTASIHWYLCTTHAHNRYRHYRCRLPVFSELQKHWTDTLDLCSAWLETRGLSLCDEQRAIESPGFIPFVFLDEYDP